VVEVVTSPSAPRVKTFSGTNSPTSAKVAKIATSGVARSARWCAPLKPSQTMQAPPIATMAET
jgi:hypothetical protein